jgi:hypothetical protein
MMKKIFYIGLISILLLVGCGKEAKKESNTNESKYKALENQMVDAAKALLNNESNTSLIPTSDNPILTIPLEWLTDGLYITDKLKDPKDNKTECDERQSYVTVEFKDDSLQYTPTLTCGEYKTKQ